MDNLTPSSRRSIFQQIIFAGTTPHILTMEETILRQEPSSAIDEYLAQLGAQLGRMPHEQQVDLCLELRQHLLLWWEDNGHCADLSGGAALGYLVREFGDPTTIGRQLARPYHTSWQQRLGQIVSIGERGFLLLVSTLLGYGFVLDLMHGITMESKPAPALISLGLPLVSVVLGGTIAWRKPHLWSQNWGLRALALVSATTLAILTNPPHEANLPHEVTNFEFWLRVGAMGIPIACGACALAATALNIGGSLCQRFKLART
ncbi:MAG: hypothetical protein JO316_24645 [Abitibacteriaceae bacterium]|nr:hypothetical protein [Abditibacteriaceae bacterium]